MLKLRLKKIGKKKFPSYRIVVMENSYKRDGKFIDDLGYYNPITKEHKIDLDKAEKWLEYGAHPTLLVRNILNKNLTNL